MGLLDDLTKEPKKQPCRVRTLANEFEPADKEIFIKAVKDLDWKAQTLANALTKKGITISGHVITRHRKGECSC